MTLFLTETPAMGITSVMGVAIMYVALFGAMYFFFVRPQKKRDRELKAAQSKLAVGNDVILSNGMFGKISDIGEDVFIVELGLNKGVRIPVKKESVLPTDGYKL